MPWSADLLHHCTHQPKLLRHQLKLGHWFLILKLATIIVSPVWTLACSQILQQEPRFSAASSLACAHVFVSGAWLLKSLGASQRLQANLQILRITSGFCACHKRKVWLGGWNGTWWGLYLQGLRCHRQSPQFQSLLCDSHPSRDATV